MPMQSEAAEKPREADFAATRAAAGCIPFVGKGCRLFRQVRAGLAVPPLVYCFSYATTVRRLGSVPVE